MVQSKAKIGEVGKGRGRKYIKDTKDTKEGRKEGRKDGWMDRKEGRKEG